MFHNTTSTRFHEAANNRSLSPVNAGGAVRGGVKNAVNRGLPHAKRLLRLTLISGPMVLFTSRISGKCAAIMMMMCAPSLLCCSILTIPALLFQSPQQNAYFHFSKVLEQDPIRWLALLLAGTCAILSLIVPATMPAPPRDTISY